MYKGYLIDLDGTIYVGQRRLKEAETFIKRLQHKNIPFLFVTNNATKTPDTVVSFLKKQCHLIIQPNQVYTSAIATVDYLLMNQFSQKGYVIGEKALTDLMLLNGFDVANENPDFVVQALDKEMTYKEIMTACFAIQKGATYITTNQDRQYPTEKGFIPGSGAISEMIQATTKITPINIGKPSSIIMQGALKRLNLNKDDVIMVGDNYDTDILAGINNDIATLLTLTGVTQKEHLKNVKKQPTFVVNNLGEFSI